MRKQSPFRHPTDIRRDDRIADLIAAHGHAGYGIYWMILEILHSHEDRQVEYDPKLIRRMAAQIGIPHEEFNSLLHDMVFDFDLFEIADSEPAMGQNGFIRSTIAYRKARKPKQNAIDIAEPNNDATILDQQDADIKHTSTSVQHNSTKDTAEEQRNGSTTAPQQHHNNSTTAAFTAAKTQIKPGSNDGHTHIQPHFENARSSQLAPS